MITVLIKELSEEYRNRFNLSSNQEINQGLCVDFADDIISLIEENNLSYSFNINIISEDFLKIEDSELWDLSIIENEYHSKLPKEISLDALNRASDTGYHVWIEVNGNFYDAECHYGVSNLFDLPFYKRFFDKL